MKHIDPLDSVSLPRPGWPGAHCIERISLKRIDTFSCLCLWIIGRPHLPGLINVFIYLARFRFRYGKASVLTTVLLVPLWFVSEGLVYAGTC